MSEIEIPGEETEVVRMRRGGLTFDQIAERLHMTPGAVYTAWVNGNARTHLEHADAIRKTEEDRLDIAQAAIWAKVVRGEIPAVLALLRIMERRAALLGLDSPEEARGEGVTSDEFARLTALVSDGPVRDTA